MIRANHPGWDVLQARHPGRVITWDDVLAWEDSLPDPAPEDLARLHEGWQDRLSKPVVIDDMEMLRQRRAARGE